MNGSEELLEDAVGLSPLWMITQEPAINDLVLYLQSAKEQLIKNPSEAFKLTFSKQQIADVRDSFSTMIREGEKNLHILCHLFAQRYFSSFQLQSVVVGEIPSNLERFTLVQNIQTADLLALTDLDQGNRQLSQIKINDGLQWVKPNLAANVIEYLPHEIGELKIHRIISRIKAEEEIWNKVTDEIFNLDSLVAKDKELKQYSRFVKDIFGIKFVVSSVEDVYKLQESISQVEFNTEELAKFGLLKIDEIGKLQLLEVKNYLNDSYRKETGWEAMKSVASWCSKTFEIQIQPLPNFLYEREGLTKESHRGFKTTRETIRNTVAQKIPLFSYYRDLLKWLFMGSISEPPQFKNVTIELSA